MGNCKKLLEILNKSTHTYNSVVKKIFFVFSVFLWLICFKKMPETNLKPHFSNYNRREPFPQFQQPRLIDGFSLEQDRSFNHSRKYLKYLRLPEEPFDLDLNVGYDTYVPGPKEVNITSLLQFIGKTDRQLIDRSGKNLAADFVCYRGLLTQIFTTPYFSRDPWTVLATKFRGTIYLCNYTSPEKKKLYEERDTEYSIKCCYYGKNFERFVLTGEGIVDLD